MKTDDSSGWEWGRVRKAKMDENNRINDGACEGQRSGCLGRAEEVHHVVARVDAGDDNSSNLMALCSVCHYRYTVELNQARAAQRRADKKAKKRKNHPGRKDRYDGTV